MYEIFETQPEEKKKKIIDASIEEFAKNSYEKASTNNIVKAAGISKGILFHYFGSKKNLYLYLVDHAMEYFTDKFYSMNDNPSPDIFDRLLQRGITKIQMANADPLKYEFIFNVFINTPEELKAEINEKYTKFYEVNMAKFYENIDTSKFRKDIDPCKAIEVIVTFMEGSTNKYIAMYKNLKPEDALNNVDTLMKDFTEYFDILKRGIIG